MGTLSHTATLDTSNYVSGINRMREATKHLSDSVVEEAGKMDETLRKFGLGVAAYFTFDTAKDFISKLTRVRGEFQQLEIGLTTMLGSKAKADALMAQITEFATKTPFELGGISAATKQLIAYGVASDQVIDVMRRLGDISSGLNIPLQDLSYLYGTTLVQGRMYAQDLMQFSNRGIPLIQELAKQFNVSTSEVKELVSQGKVGFPEVEKAIKAMTDEGGRFAGLTEQNSQALTGLISNLEDAISNAYNSIGQQQEGLLTDGIKGAIFLVEHYEEIAKAIGVVIAAMGTYKAALIAVNLYQKASIILGNVQAWLSLAKSVRTAKDAMVLFNLACESNPLILAASAIVAAATAFYLFSDSADSAEKELTSLQKVQQKVIDQVETERAKIDSLTQTLSSNVSTLEQKQAAIDSLSKLIPNYRAELDEEGRVINENTQAIRDYLVQLEKQIQLKAAQEELEELYRRKRKAENTRKENQDYIDKNQPKLDAQQAAASAQYEQNRSMFMDNTELAVTAMTATLSNVDGELAKSLSKAKSAVSSAEAELKTVGDEIATIRSEIETTTAAINQSNASSLANSKSYAAQLADTTAKIARLRKEIAALRDGTTASSDYAKDISEKEKELRQAESDLRILQGGSSKEERIRKRKQKLALEQENTDALVSQARETQRAVTQASIDAMQEGFAKTVAAQEFEHRKNLENIQIRAEEMKRATYAYNKRVWEQTHKGIYEDSKAGKGGWQSVQLTQDQQAHIDALVASETSRWAYLQEANLATQISGLYSYLKEYGSIQEQKFAISKEYDAKIAKEQDFWRKKQLEAERDSVLDRINSEDLVRQLNLETIFSDYGKVLAGPLETTLEALEEYTKSDAFKKRSFEEQKSIYQSMDSARRQLGTLGGVSMSDVGKNLYAYNEALIAYNQATADMVDLARRATEAEEAEILATQRLASVRGTAAEAEAARAEAAAKSANETAKANYAQGQARQRQAQTLLAEAQNKASDSLREFQQSIESVGSIASAVASGSMSQLWKSLGVKTQSAIGSFLSGSLKYRQAISDMTSTLMEQGQSMTDFVDSIKSLAKEILDSGDLLENVDIKGKVQELFNQAFGEENLDISEFGDKISKIVSEVLGKGKEEGEETMDTIEKVSDEVVKAITKSSGSLWGLIIGLVLDLLDVLGEGVGALVKALLDSVGNAIEGILTEIGNGQFFVRIFEGVGNIVAGLVRGVANLFSGGLAFGEGNTKEMQEKVDELIIANEALAERIASLTESIKDADATNSESIEAYKKAIEAQKEWEQNQRDAIDATASAWTNSGYGFLGLGGKKSFNYHMGDLPSWVWDAFSQTLKDHGMDKDVNASNIWSLTPEEMRILRDFSPAAWAELFSGEGHKNPLDLVNEYIDQSGALDGLTDDLNEKLTGVSWDSFKESYISLLADLSSTTEDFAENIGELITNALITSFVNSAEIQQRIRKLYEKIAEYASDTSEGGTELTQSEIDDIRKTNEELTQDMIDYRQSLIDAGIISNTDPYSQSASKGGFAAMSQETGEALEGRFTAIQIGVTSILAGVLEMRSLMLIQINHMGAIEKYTQRLIAIQESLEKIENNTSNI